MMLQSGCFRITEVPRLRCKGIAIAAPKHCDYCAEALRLPDDCSALAQSVLFLHLRMFFYLVAYCVRADFNRNFVIPPSRSLCCVVAD